MRKYITLLLTTILITVFITGCQRKNIDPTVFSGFYFDTYITITIYDEVDNSLIEGLDNLCKHYENLFSEDNESSDIYKLNHPCDSERDIEVDEEVAYVLGSALEFAGLTEGRVDPTIYAVSNLWDFSGESTQLPEKSDIEKALATVNYENVIVKDNIIHLEANQQLALGFIAKGYIANRIKDYLEQNGISDALINLGGNIVCMGAKPDGSIFNLAVKEPFTDDGVIYKEQLTECSMVTSGVYERYFYNDGQLYHHVLDTSTGYPVHNYIDASEIYSVTVIGESSMICDALSTTLLILGYDEGKEFMANCYPYYRAIFVDSENNVFSVNY